MSEIGKMWVSISAKTEELDKAMQTAQQKMQTVGKSMTMVGAGLTAAITVPIVAIGTMAFKSANDVDQAMKTIRAGTGATGDALKGLEVSFKNVFGTVPQDAATVGQAIADVNTRLGLTGPSLEAMTKKILDLARITGSDVTATITGVTRLFGDWGVATDKQSDTMDYMLKVSQNTGIGVDQLARSMVQFGAPLRQMGFGMEEAMAIMGKWEKEGVNLELVMGSLRIGLGNFARAGEDAPAALRRVIDEMQNMESASDATAMAMEIFGARAGPDMAAAIREGRLEVGDLMAILDASGETIESATADTLSFSEQMDIMKNKAGLALEPLGKVLIELFQKALPHIEKLVGFIQGLSEKFAALSPTMQTIILAGVGLLAALGPLLMILGPLIMLFASIGPAIAAVGAIMGFILGPIGLVIAIIAALIAIGIVLYKNWDTIKEFAINIWNSIMGFFTTVWEGIKGIFTGALQFILDLFLNYTLPGLIISHWTEIKEFFANIWKNIKEIFTTVIITIGTFLKERWESIKQSAINIWEQLKQGVIDKAIALKDKIIETVNTAMDWIKRLPAQALQWGRDIIQGLINGVRNMASSLIGAIKGVVNSAVSAVKNALGIGSPSKVFMNIGLNMGEGLENGIKAAQKALSGASIGMTAPSLQMAGVSAGGGQSQVIYVELDGKVIGKAIGKPFMDTIRVKTGMSI